MARVEELETVLRRHVLEAWFPRSLDHEAGGFLADFDRNWNSSGPHDKLLEFQARQTFTAADASRAYPDDPRYLTATLHGFRYLRDVLWDHDAGGWFHRLDRSGKRLEAETKHAHGAAYAIDACAAVYAATGDSSALDHARQGFEWLDRYARDRVHGGYFGFFKRDNTLIRERSQSPLGSEVDTVETVIGLKDANVQSDLLETFVALYRVWPDPTLGDRLAEMLEIMSAKMVDVSTGRLHIYVQPDWTPVPHRVRAGYQSQTVVRLGRARFVADAPARIDQLSMRMMDLALQHTRDLKDGGFFYASSEGGDTPAEKGSRSKVWWVQVEALKALSAMSRLAPERVDYRREVDALWRYFTKQFVDSRHGGVYRLGLDEHRRWQRALGASFAPPYITRKGEIWKDASHEARALLYCIDALRSP